MSTVGASSSSSTGPARTGTVPACAAIAAFSRAVLALQEQADEVEVNPLLVRPAGHGVCMLDALVLSHPAQG